MTLLELLNLAAGYLEEKGVPEARLGAELLLARVLETDRVGLYLGFDKPVGEGEKDSFRALLKRRAQREPVAYILGEKEFYSLSFEVSPAVLIPRPETELLVEEAAKELFDPSLPAPKGSALVVDVGAGSGAVSCALAIEHENTRILATEINREATRLARRNVLAHGLKERVHLVVADILECIMPGTISLVVSNPPYVPAGEIGGLAPEIGYEPEEAINGGPDGLDVVKRLIPQAAERLLDGGRLLMEIGQSQADEVEKMLLAHGFGRIGRIRDLAGIERVVRGVKHG